MPRTPERDGRWATANPHDGPPSCLVVKVGGSLFSDKHRDDGLDAKSLDRWAAATARLARAHPGRLIFVTGGGSIGHGAVRHLDPADPFAALPLTRANFELKWMWTQRLRGHGAVAMPLQLAAMCSVGAAGPRTSLGPLTALLRAGALPVLSGDSLINEDGRLEVLGSDRVPEAVLGACGARPRVVTLTDTPGIFADGANGRRLLRLIEPDDAGEARAAVRASTTWDTSSSMAGKLDALLRSARRGAECFVMQGDPSAELGFLFDPIACWPRSVLYTRIALSAGDAPASAS